VNRAENESETARHILRGRFLVGLATVFWGCSATLARYVFRDFSVPPLDAIESRLVIAVTLLGAWLALSRPSAFRIRREDIGYFLILGIFGMAAVQSAYYHSIARLGVGLAILIQYLAPSIIVLNDLAHGRPVRRSTWFGVLVALLGTALLIGNVDRSLLRASALDWAIGFGAAFAFAFYIIYSKRGLARYAPETVLFYNFFVAAVFWMIVYPPARVLAAGYGPGIWAAFFALGVLNNLIPFALFYAGLRHLAPSQAGIMATLEPVVAVLAAALFLGEGLRPLQWVGAAGVLAASILATRNRPEVMEARAESG
jgi:drug/metabolite transporter (DMT)-like permease